MTNLSNFKPIKTKHSIIGHTPGMGTASVNPDLGVIVMLVLGRNRVAFSRELRIGFWWESRWVFVGITLDFRSIDLVFRRMVLVLTGIMLDFGGISKKIFDNYIP